MRRREFLGGVLGGAAATFPLALRAQQSQRMRRVGILSPLPADDANGQVRIAAFLQGLQEFGWAVDRNVRMEIRWGGKADDMRKYAAELAALAPEVILAPGSASTGPLLQATRAVPIVFVHVADPVGAGFVESLARPGGNATGFTLFEYATSAKWLELLKQIAPDVKRVAITRDATIGAGIGQFSAIQAMAQSLSVEITPVNVRDAADIERGVVSLTRVPNGGLIVPGSGSAVRHRDLIVTLAAQHKLPAVYFERLFVAAGGLISYGPDLVHQYRQAAGYVDRILKGEKPADMPVQAPTKYQLVINLKTAKAIGFTFPPAVHARADEVIE
jgi:putative ABC transport system substrate-binding protein